MTQTPEEVAAGPAGEQPAGPSVPEAVRVAAGALEPRLAERPVVALVLGSGLGGLADEVEGATRIPAAELPGMPRPRSRSRPGSRPRSAAEPWSRPTPPAASTSTTTRPT